MKKRGGEESWDGKALPQRSEGKFIFCVRSLQASVNCRTYLAVHLTAKQLLHIRRRSWLWQARPRAVSPSPSAHHNTTMQASWLEIACGGQEMGKGLCCVEASLKNFVTFFKKSPETVGDMRNKRRHLR